VYDKMESNTRKKMEDERNNNKEEENHLNIWSESDIKKLQISR
jgi:hypothetical protein